MLIISTYLASEEASTERGGRMVNIKFSDTGMGILPGNLPHIFEPFLSNKAGLAWGCG